MWSMTKTNDPTDPNNPNCTKPIYKKVAIAVGAFIAGAFLTAFIGIIGIYLVLLAPPSIYNQRFIEPWLSLNINAGGIKSINHLQTAETELNRLIQSHYL
jgi:hypothetical protein